jgi:uncharacterized membrane protein
MVTLLAIVTCAGAGLIGGVFFAFSAFVMKALTELPDEQGITAMQRINVVVLDPLFLGVFLGTAILAATCTFAAFYARGSASSLLLFIAGMSYLVGSVGVTMAFNVPRNERLARLPSASPEAAAYWPAYVREWLVWNHVRAAASIVSAVSAAAALAW